MSKGHDAGAKPEHKPEAKAAAPAEKAAKDGHTGEVKRPEQHKKPEAPKGKGHTPLPDGCHSWGCKQQAKRFNFCAEHYEHFKFGLIKKTGEPVSDYEKKIEHFLAYQAKQKKAAQKVA